MTDHPLDDPARAALHGPHAALAEQHGSARRYSPDVSPFAAPPASPAEWRDLAELVGAGADAVLPTLHPEVPPGWTNEWELAGVQLVEDGGRAGAAEGHPDDPEILLLTDDDVPEMLALVERTRPGPFGARTIRMGHYRGIREDGRLIAMAGERLHVPGWTEISAVCTDAEHRGRGLGGRLVLAVAAGIHARGEQAFLHAAAANTNAIRLYEELGFRLRARPWFLLLRASADGSAGNHEVGNTTTASSTEQSGPTVTART